MVHHSPINLSHLRDLLDEHFALDELRSLCLDLDIPYENLSGNTRRDKIISLIENRQRQGQLETLLVRLHEERPQVAWDTVRRPPAESTGFDDSTWPKPMLTPRYRAIGFALLVLLGVAVLVVLRSGCLCTYKGEDDYQTIVQIIRAESLAVNSGDLSLITKIFATTAYIKQTDNQTGSVTEWFDPLSRYRPLFENTQFSGAQHTQITGTVNGNFARFTSGSQGSFVADGEYGEYDHTAGNSQEEEVWTLEQNFWGCWKITRFEFH